MCYFFHICTFLHILDLSGRKRGAKGYVGPEFGYFVILTRDACIEIDWYCIICKYLVSFQFILLTPCRQVTDILKMCMKKFHAEKYFETNLQSFINLPIVSRAYFK